MILKEECYKLAELLKKRKIFYRQIIKGMTDEEYFNKICKLSKTFECMIYQNEKVFSGISKQLPKIKVNDDTISFNLQCERYAKSGFCLLKRITEENKKNERR